jgi:hypothetical protein
MLSVLVLIGLIILPGMLIVAVSDFVMLSLRRSISRRNETWYHNIKAIIHLYLFESLPTCRPLGLSICPESLETIFAILTRRSLTSSRCRFR